MPQEGNLDADDCRHQKPREVMKLSRSQARPGPAWHAAIAGLCLGGDGECRLRLAETVGNAEVQHRDTVTVAV